MLQEFKRFDLDGFNEDEETRLESIQIAKLRGKGAPKKKRTASGKLACVLKLQLWLALHTGVVCATEYRKDTDVCTYRQQEEGQEVELGKFDAEFQVRFVYSYIRERYPGTRRRYYNKVYRLMALTNTPFDPNCRPSVRAFHHTCTLSNSPTTTTSITYTSVHCSH